MPWLTLKESAHYVHRREADIRCAVAAGELAGWKPKGKEKGTIVHTDDIDAWVRGTYDPAMCINAARRVVAMTR